MKLLSVGVGWGHNEFLTHLCVPFSSIAQNTFCTNNTCFPLLWHIQDQHIVKIRYVCYFTVDQSLKLKVQHDEHGSNPSVQVPNKSTEGTS